MAFRFGRADLPDLPPPDFRGLPPAPGVKIQYFDSQPDLQKWALGNHISPGSAYGQRQFWGGYAPSIQTVGLLRPGLKRDQAWDDRIYIHEVGGHSNGLVHRPGTDADWGLIGPDGTFHPVQTPAELAALKARLYPPTLAAFDWSKPFAGTSIPQAPSQRVAVVPMKNQGGS